MDSNFDTKGTFAKVHIISIFSEKDADYMVHFEKVDKIVLKSLSPAGAEIGDLIVEKNVSGYRTDGVYIVGHNKKIMTLSEEPDDYGTLPSEFRIWKFINPRTGKKVNHDYWHGALSQNPDCKASWHNNMVYFDPGDFGLYFDREDVFKPKIFSSSRNYGVTIKIGGRDYFLCTEDNLTRKEFYNRVNTPGYIEMANNDVKKKYRTTAVVFRV
uniref:Uncharacterized protein n=1 Tax=Marseillevirus LCMAC101 TaxID=2506602 RepID=A0A481YS55_9VIRU|nr:MAG: hypothetical protein LCMAC101_04740 [Marseillevirus LCMAC101]